MKTLPYFIATAVSTAVQCIYLVVVTGISYLAMRPILENPGVVPDINLPVMFGGTFLISCIGMIAAPVVHIGTGLLYAFLHRREGSMTTEQGVLGGAAAAGTARFMTALFSIMLSVVVSAVMMRGFSAPNMPGMPGNYPFLPINTAASSIGGLIGGCFSTLLAAALGALGGLLPGAFGRASNE